MSEEMFAARLGQIEVAYYKRLESGYELLYLDLIKNLIRDLEKWNEELIKEN